MARAVLPNPSARAEWLFAGIIDRALHHWGHVPALDGGLGDHDLDDFETDTAIPDDDDDIDSLASCMSESGHRVSCCSVCPRGWVCRCGPTMAFPRNEQGPPRFTSAPLFGNLHLENCFEDNGVGGQQVLDLLVLEDDVFQRCLSGKLEPHSVPEVQQVQVRSPLA